MKSNKLGKQEKCWIYQGPTCLGLLGLDIPNQKIKNEIFELQWVQMGFIKKL